MNGFASGIIGNKTLSVPFELHASENGLEFIILFFKGFQSWINYKILSMSKTTWKPHKNVRKHFFDKVTSNLK